MLTDTSTGMIYFTKHEMTNVETITITMPHSILTDERALNILEKCHRRLRENNGIELVVETIQGSNHQELNQKYSITGDDLVDYLPILSDT